MDPLTIASLAGVLVKLAPDLARFIGGDKAGKAAATAVDLARKVTGESDPHRAVEQLQASPEDVLAYQQAVAANEVELSRAHLADVADARARDLSIREANHGRNRRADALAGAAVLLLGALVGGLFFVPIPDGPGRDALLIVVGAVVALVKDVYQFEFGSSRGSKEKTDALNRAMTPRGS